MNAFDTVIAFGDSFSSGCGTFRDLTTQELSINQRVWTDFSSGLQGNPIFDNCANNGGLDYLNYLTGCTQNGIDPMSCSTRLINLATDVRHNLSYPLAEGDGDLAGQVESWSKHVEPNLYFNAQTTLVSLFHGRDEVRRVASQLTAGQEPYGLDVVVEESVLEHLNNLEACMVKLCKAGLRHFLIFNLPSDMPGASKLISAWNTLLSSITKNFQEHCPQAVLYMMDTSEFYSRVLADPDAYAIGEVQHSCLEAQATNASLDCSGTSDYFHMDTMLWTPRAHQELSRAINDSLAHQMSALNNSDTVHDDNSPTLTTSLASSIHTAILTDMIAAWSSRKTEMVFLALGCLLIFVMVAWSILRCWRREYFADFLALIQRQWMQVSTYTQLPANEVVGSDVELQER